MEDVGIAWGLLPAALFLSGAAFVLFCLLPPVASRTGDTEQYLILDEALEEYEEEIRSVFPEEIPSSARDVTYQYRMYEAFFSREFTITLSMTLPEEEYAALKLQTLEKAGAAENENGEGELLVSFTGQKGGLKMEVRFDDAKQRTEFYVNCEKNI